MRLFAKTLYGTFALCLMTGTGHNRESNRAGFLRKLHALGLRETILCAGNIPGYSFSDK
ncbi:MULTISPECIES: hypothetical protein [unclassified Ruegeria]|uniref:hypothetical protein n=1 Tax=unclassified Ruegeria TaxID=2625375 RepID=UPI00148A0411|nr:MULTISPECIES: hypothetical protein [unclassified Ruegeria]NOD89460.1 hypothetical protein [Ruegeria sp. HKCCD4318]NOE13783.1 hypothetical protein [Ruegeria sp. HKCCD4318-2]NOG08282.1 hypothetical protein [Ruegeria sp. HKCCD4315]